MSSSQDSVSRSHHTTDGSELPSRLGPYDVEGEIGAGAMGVVYRARDPRLDRTVALKALPAAFAEDSERLARFEREARMLAALHHPHVASLHGLEEHDGRRYLVMEFVAGETLGERIARGTLDPQEALELAEQIARGLAAAHDAGIIHRDLKPGNVLVTPDGRAKVVDFGLAKDVAARQPAAEAAGVASRPAADEITLLSAPESSNLDPTRLTSSFDSIGPTVVAQPGSSSDPVATEPGAILGTAAYMSPEQARGRPLDRRTDIWSFGCVLYEMLTRQRPFRGDNLTQTIVAVLQKEPDWSHLPAETPRPVRRLLERCLRKDPRDRLRDLGDAALELQELRSGTWSADEWPGPVAGAGSAGQNALRVLAALAALVVVAWLGWWLRPMPEGPQPFQGRLEFPLEAPLYLGDQGTVRLSPDGRLLAWIGYDPEAAGTTRIYLRPLDSFETTLLEGIEDPNGIFFSPDSQWIGYLDFRRAQVRKVSTTSGAGTEVISEGVTAGSKGGTWLEDGSVVVGMGFAGGLGVVRPDRRTVEELTERGPGVKTHRFPEALPGGRHLLFTESDIDVDSFDQARIRYFDLDAGEPKTLFEGGSHASFVSAGAEGVPGAPEADGWILFLRSDLLMSIPFDLESATVFGSPVPAVSDVLGSSLTGFGLYSEAQDVLAFAAGVGGFESSRLVRVWRDGRREVLDAPPRAYRLIRPSADGERLLLHIDSATGDLWLYDLNRGVLGRLTSKWDNLMPVWTADGDIVYASNFDRLEGIYRQAAGGGAEPWLFHPQLVNPESWTPDGQWMVATRSSPELKLDLIAIPGDGGEPRILVSSPAFEYGGEVSASGWLAYTSDETGSFEVYVRPFDAPGPRLQVSVGGGVDPVFSAGGDSAGGDEILYARGTDIYAVSFDPSAPGGPQLGAPELAFEGIRLPSGGPPERIWDLMPDGSLIYPEPEFEPSGVRSLRLVVGFRDELAAASGGG